MSPSSCSLLGKGGEGADVAQPLPPLGGERKSWPWWGQQVPVGAAGRQRGDRGAGRTPASFLGKGREAGGCPRALCGAHCGRTATKHFVIPGSLCPGITPRAEFSWKRLTLAGCRWPAGLEEGQVQAVPRGEGHRLSRVDAGVVKPCSAVIREFWRRGLEGPR